MRSILTVLMFTISFLSSCSNGKSPALSNYDFEVSYYPDSSVNEIVQKRNQKIEGKVFKFDELGSKLWEFNIVNDKQEGMQYYYFNQGELNFAVPYKNGKRHGWATRHTGPCGNISEEGQYENDEKNGLWYEYHDSELLEIDLYNDGKLIKIVYRNKKYPDRNSALPPLAKDCGELWTSGE